MQRAGVGMRAQPGEVVRRAPHTSDTFLQLLCSLASSVSAPGLDLASLPTGWGPSSGRSSLRGVSLAAWDREDHPARAGKGQDLPLQQCPVSSTRPLMHPKKPQPCLQGPSVP